MRVLRVVAALGVLLAAAVVPASPASANVGISASLTLPVAVTVGQPGRAGSFTIINTNTPPHSTESNVVTQIRLALSCGTASSAGNLCSVPDPGVFSIDSPATGRAGTACAGRTFTVSAPDGAGIVTFTPTGGPIVVAPPGGSNMCAVDFTFSVLKQPTVDVDPPTAGVQTRANLLVTMQGAVSGLVVSSRPSLLITVVGAPPPVPSSFTPLTPSRVWDSRLGPGPVGRIGAGQTRDVTVAGMGGVPATGVTAVVVNVTALLPSAQTYVTVWPTGEAKPLASNLNIPPGDVRPNLVIVKVGAGGKISFYNDTGSLDLIADVAGYYGDTGDRYTPLSPARVWDSRFGPGPVGRVGAGQTREITVTGVGGVPATGVTAVVLNVTAVVPSAATFVTAWPTGEAKPLASNLNVPAGDVRPNLVIVKVGAGGKVSLYNDAGSLDLIADVAGYYGSTGSRLSSLSPSRVWDSRFGPGPVGRIGAGQTREVTVTGVSGVPASGVTAVVLNVTAVSPSAATYVTAWPTGEVQPLASNLNVPPGDVRPNLVIVKVGAGGRVSFNNAAGSVDLLADVAGFYGAAGA